MVITRQNIQSIESKLSFGFNADEITLYSTDESDIKNHNSVAFGSLWFHMSLDVVEHQRTIYGTLDLLADIGGLSDILYIIGGNLVAVMLFLSGSGLNRFLISSIFKLNGDTSNKRTSNSLRNALDVIESRTQFPVKICKFFCQSSKLKKMEEMADSLVFKELDIVRFIRR